MTAKQVAVLPMMAIAIVLMLSISTVTAISPIKQMASPLSSSPPQQNVESSATAEYQIPALTNQTLLATNKNIDLSAVKECTTSTTYVINNASGIWGCNYILAYSSYRFNFSANYTRSYQMTLTGYSSSYVDIVYGNDTITRYYPNSTTRYFTWPAGAVTSIYYWSGGWAAQGLLLLIQAQQAATPQKLVSAQPFTLQQQFSGGFQYFALPYLTRGKMYTMSLQVFGYQGLQSPSVYISVNNIPSFERYDYTNVTVSRPGQEQVTWTQTPPRDGQYWVAVYLYGTSNRISVTAQWTYNIRPIFSGAKVSNVTNNIDYYQLTVPVNTPALRFQFSRLAPGGYPIAYILKGEIPTATRFNYTADTSMFPYYSYTIYKPNPAGNTAPNPGNWIIAVYPGPAGLGNSGYIMQFDW